MSEFDAKDLFFDGEPLDQIIHHYRCQQILIQGLKGMPEASGYKALGKWDSARGYGKYPEYKVATKQ